MWFIIVSGFLRLPGTIFRSGTRPRVTGEFGPIFYERSASFRRGWIECGFSQALYYIPPQWARRSGWLCHFHGGVHYVLLGVLSLAVGRFGRFLVFHSRFLCGSGGASFGTGKDTLGPGFRSVVRVRLGLRVVSTGIGRITGGLHYFVRVGFDRLVVSFHRVFSKVFLYRHGLVHFGLRVTAD